MKVFAVYMHEVYDFGELSTDVELFEKREDALKVFAQWADKMRRYAEKNSLIIDYDTEDNFKSYASYEETYSVGWVRELEIH